MYSKTAKLTVMTKQLTKPIEAELQASLKTKSLSNVLTPPTDTLDAYQGMF